ncbi:MAG: sigma-70 family RNA polymerase sigma factor [Planctomycetia bacterium]|nr:sigma-70 family RNA polymerase sigma factor [Planctomycetia bacterium]
MPDPVTIGVQQLFVRHQPALRSFAIALTGDFAAAEDVVQETFLTITAKAADFEPGTNFVAWACAIARLKVLENRRAVRRFSPAVVDALADAIPADELGADLGCERLPQLLACLEELPPKARELVRLRYFLEQGPTVIAESLGRSVAGVNAALQKAREALRICVARRLAAEGTGVA